MSLTLRPDSQWWYGKFRLPNGKFQVKNLNVEVKGVRPATLREVGDEVFEASRAVARNEHDKLLTVIEDKRAGVKFAKAQLELATAKKHVSPSLGDLPDQWAADHHIRLVKDGDGHLTGYEGQRSESHVEHSRGALARFARFMGAQYPEVKNMAGATSDQVRAFMDTLDAERLAPRTWNYYLVLLREMFQKHEPDTSACEYLRDTEERDEGTTHRKPYSDEQLRAIDNAANKDPFIRPIIVVGLNTPMRLGDCCKLLWHDVDLSDRFLTVKRTSKTKQGVQIPIWPQLYEELKELPRSGDHVFPELAKMYQENPYGINLRLKRIFQAAGITFYNSTNPPRPLEAGQAKPAKSPTAGKVGRGVGKGSGRRSAPGPRRVNEMAFQSFRVTYVTRALLRGVNEEVLRKATGHRTVDIVRKHYFQPAKEVMRAELDKGRPDLKDDSQSPGVQMRGILLAMKAKTWKSDRDQLLVLLETSGLVGALAKLV